MRLDVSSLPPLNPAGGSEYRASCPFCGENRKRFYVNFEKGVFCCHNCGIGGNLTTDEQESVFVLKKLRKKEEKIPQLPLAKPEVRDRVYRQLFQALTLSKPHLDHLLLKRDYDARKALETFRSLEQKRIEPATQVARFCDPSGVPGFYPLSNDRWCLAGPNGLLIPAQNFEGLIWGIQIRRDETDKWRYQWLSSRKERNGTKAAAVYHVTVPKGIPIRTIWVTEGRFKGDKGAQELQQPFVAVAGVNTWKSIELVPDLKNRGVERVVIAYDSDFAKVSYNTETKKYNMPVAKAAWELAQACHAAGIKVAFAVWVQEFKGIDDLLFAGYEPRLITVKEWKRLVKEAYDNFRKNHKQ